MGHNPILPLEYHIPDCEAHVMRDGRLYLYGSLDTSAGQYCSTEYHVVSTADMECWTVHPHAFSTKMVPWATGDAVEKESQFQHITSAEELPDYIKRQIPPELLEHFDVQQFLAGVKAAAKQSAPEEAMLYAPDAICANGKYYLYFCLSDETEGVAVSDRPEGPFQDAVRLPAMGIDPAVFIDDDGSAYYYWGQFSAKGVKLNEDMISFDESKVVEGILTEKEHFFHEGSSLRKRGDIYYYVYADISSGKPTALGYATGNSPLGPFTYRGTIIDNIGCDPASWNNHGSIEEFGGQWYVFYHRSSRNSNSMRRVCVEPIHFDENGLILPVVQTSQGAGMPYGPGEWMPAWEVCCLRGSACLDAWEDTEAVTGICDGDSVVYRYFSCDREMLYAEFDTERVAWAELFVNGEFAGKGSSRERIPIRIPAGTYEVEIRFQGVENGLFHGMRLHD